MNEYINDSFGSATIKALVERQLAEYCDWRKGQSGEFPVAVKPATSLI